MQENYTLYPFYLEDRATALLRCIRATTKEGGLERMAVLMDFKSNVLGEDCFGIIPHDRYSDLQRHSDTVLPKKRGEKRRRGEEKGRKECIKRREYSKG